MISPYIQIKKVLGDRLKENEPLARYTTFKIGGSADLYYEAKTVEELTIVVSIARKNGIGVFVIGGGSNILISDNGVRGLVVKNSTNHIIIRGAKGMIKRQQSQRIVYVEVDSGVMINTLVRYTIEEGLQGLEMHLGLPGTVGGALYMNSKWTKPAGYVGDALYQATIVTPKGDVTVVPTSYFHFGYDQSSIQHTGDIVTKAVFALNRDDPSVLWETANASIAYRRETQPQGVFSPGCTFKNMSKAQALSIPTPNHTTSAGFLLDNAGLKGYTVGDAQISPIHANFIINLGNATSQDVIAVIEYARKAVEQQFGVRLEEEIVRIGEM